MKGNIKEKITRLIILFVGLCIAHLGVTLFLQANLGADPFNVFVQGLTKLAETTALKAVITHGRIHMLISLLIIIVLLIADRSYIKIGTVVCMFCGGPIIDFFNWVLTPLGMENMNLPLKIQVNIIGCAILAYGMTIVIKSEAGTGPNDLVAVVISDKSKKKFGIVRVIVDALFAATGFLLGGTLGIGTVICAFVVGPVAGYFMPVNERLIGRLVNR